MDQRSAYLLQILEKIGTPLMGAITAVRGGDTDEGQDAQTIAALLGKTVQAGIDLGQVIETNPADAMDDSLRVALTALAGPLVAGQYKKRAALPDDAGLKRIVSSLQAVLTFSDNFTPSAENAARLKDLSAQGQSVDAAQTQIQYVQAFIPVVEAVAAFPFGQPEQKLLMEVSERLSNTAVEMRETLLPHLTEEHDQKRAELAFLNSLAGVYSSVHIAETRKVTEMGEAAREANIGMESVWKQFETRILMLQALATSIVPGVSKPAQSAAQAVTQAAEQQDPSQDQAQTQPPAQPPAHHQAPPPVQQEPPASVPPPIAAPQTPPPAQTASPPAASNPMSMFAKPKADEPPPAQAAPPAPIQAAPPEVKQPPAQAQNESSGDSDGEKDSGGQSSGGGPMSFFKKSE